MTYETLERWVFEESNDPDDESRKEVQVVRDRDNDGIYVRTAYYGPSGRYGQDAPTYDPSEENQHELIGALEEAFPRAREIRQEQLIEETLSESEFDADELQRLVTMAEEAGGIEELEDRLD